MQTYPDGFNARPLPHHEHGLLAAISTVIHAKKDLRNHAFLTKDRHSMDILKPRRWDLQVTYGGEVVPVEVEQDLERDVFIVDIEDETFEIANNFNLTNPIINALINGEQVTFQLMSKTATGYIKLQYFGTVHELQVLSHEMADHWKHMPAKHERDVSTMVIAPMPGMVKSVSVKVGDHVSEGQEVMVLEAMKMQNSMLAGKSAVVKKVNVKTGETVSEDDVLIELE
jgi:propionyl-CoA carboxylase alpha chain